MIFSSLRNWMPAAFLFVSLLQPSSAARAELVLSQLVVELNADRKLRDDIEIWNNSPERVYVAAEPSEIIHPGQLTEARRQEADPEKRGLLVSPARMILEPGQRKLVRVAALSPDRLRERVYRVTIRPVAGALSPEQSGLKILVGYDVLVLVRPADPRPKLVGKRAGNILTFRNEGNSSIELVDGRQCEAGGECVELPGKRLYAGAEWSQQLRSSSPVEYRVVIAGESARRTF